MSEIENVVLNKLKIYQDRISELENSLAQKDNEVSIYKLAVERLQAVVKQLSQPEKSTPGTKPTTSAARTSTQ
jgi:hypothetical protein